jgi:hypothetical protein
MIVETIAWPSAWRLTFYPSGMAGHADRPLRVEPPAWISVIITDLCPLGKSEYPKSTMAKIQESEEIQQILMSGDGGDDSDFVRIGYFGIDKTGKIVKDEVDSFRIAYRSDRLYGFIDRLERAVVEMGRE